MNGAPNAPRGGRGAAPAAAGSCTLHGECEAACPKEISIDFIALMNRDYVKAQFKQRRLASQRG